MPDMLQDFKGSNCDNIVAQGDVVFEQRYVRTTVIEESLDSQLLEWEKKENTILTFPAQVVVGLPISLISGDEAYSMTSPQKISRRKKNDLYVGTDRVVLPGTHYPGPSRRILKVRERDLNRKSKPAPLNNLTAGQVSKLRLTGEITVSRKSEAPLTLRLTRAASAKVQMASGKSQPGKQPTFSSSAFAVVDEHSIFRHVVDTLFNGNLRAAAEALLADPRAGSLHVEEYADSAELASLPDDTFEHLLAILQMHPNWQNLVQNAPKPELPQFSIGLVQVFKQTQRLKGFSRGRLIESVTLGPEESVSVEVFSFDRTVEQTEQTRSIESTSELERTRNQSQSVEIGNDIERTVNASVGAELGVSLPIEAVSVDASVSNNVSAEIATRNQTTANLLTEASSRAAETYKSTHQVKTLTRRETGTETRTTRSFKNPNLGRTLNLHHFEVVGHYETKTTLDEDTQFCLLVETPEIGPFDRDWIRAHHDFLDNVLTHDVYRQGLEAANLLAAQEWLDELAAAEKRAREEELQRIAQETADAPADNYIPNKGIFATAKRLREKAKLYEDLGTMESAVETLADHLNPFANVSVNAIADAEDLISRWAWWTQFGAAYPGAHEALQKFSKDYDDAIARSSQPDSADDLIAAVGELTELFDDDWLMALKLFGAAYIISYLMFIPAMVNAAVYLYVMKLLYVPNDKGIPKIISSARADYAQHKAKQSAETLAPPAPAEETLKPENLPPKPPRAYSEKELAEAHASMGRLILHLEQNKSHYNNEFYKREDPALRIDRLTQLGIARFAGNRLLGFAGTRSIYPLNLQALSTETQTYLQGLVPSHTNFDVDQATTTSTIPTGGFVSEAVLGECEALEPYLLERRKQDLRTRELQNLILEQRLSNPGAAPTDPDI